MNNRSIFPSLFEAFIKIKSLIEMQGCEVRFIFKEKFRRCFPNQNDIEAWS